MRSNGRAFHPIHLTRAEARCHQRVACAVLSPDCSHHEHPHRDVVWAAKYFYCHDARLGQSGRYCRYR